MELIARPGKYSMVAASSAWSSGWEGPPWSSGWEGLPPGSSGRAPPSALAQSPSPREPAAPIYDCQSMIKLENNT